MAKVVDKFVLQLEAQLADRNVTIELSDEARDWLVENGYDDAMGARPMARLIQSTIKTPLADEVLFGKLKDGGAVRVVLQRPEGEEAGAPAKGKGSLGFEFPAGPVTPRPEKDVTNAAKRHKRSKPRSAPRKKPGKGDGGKGGPTGGASGGGGVRTVPKVPLKV